MASAVTAKTKISMLREAKRLVQRHISTRRGGAVLIGLHQQPEKPGYSAESSAGKADQDSDNSSCWVPHPRTGIYFPEGHEWVMEDVPVTAACFEQTYWLRNVEGVEEPDPDTTFLDPRYMSTNIY